MRLWVSGKMDSSCDGTAISISSSGKLEHIYEKFASLRPQHQRRSNVNGIAFKYATWENDTLPFPSPVRKISLAICYDSRFLEMALQPWQLGADVLNFPDASATRTGAVHWGFLLKRFCSADVVSCYCNTGGQVWYWRKSTELWSCYGIILVVEMVLMGRLLIPGAVWLHNIAISREKIEKETLFWLAGIDLDSRDRCGWHSSFGLFPPSDEPSLGLFGANTKVTGGLPFGDHWFSSAKPFQ